MTQRNWTLAAFFVAVTALPSFASAQSTERPLYVGGGAGVAIELDSYPTQFMIAEEIGYHLFGTTDGLFIGGAFAQSFGRDIVTLQFGARVGYDIALYRSQDIGVLLAPSVAPGVVVAIASVNTPFGTRSGSDSGFNFQAAMDIKLLLLDEALEVFFRPVTLDIFVGDGTAARWNVLAGAQGRF